MKECAILLVLYVSLGDVVRAYAGNDRDSMGPALTQADPIEGVTAMPSNMPLYGFLAVVVTLTMLISYFAPDMSKSQIYQIKAKESLKALYKYTTDKDAVWGHADYVYDCNIQIFCRECVG